MSDLLPNTITDAPRNETQEGKLEGENPITNDMVIAEDQKTTLLPEKFKSTEDLIKAYKNAEIKISEVTAKLKDYEAPAEYAIEIELPEQAANEIKELAKQSGLTQAQLNKMLGTLHAKQIEARQKVEAQLTAVEKEFGPDKLKKLDNFVDQTYATMPAIAKAIKQEYRLNKEVANQFYQTRENALQKVLPVGGYTAELEEGAIDKKMRELANKLDPVSTKEFAKLALTKAKMKNLIT